jgi:hypothetical protein
MAAVVPGCEVQAVFDLELTKEVDFSPEASGGCRLPRRLDWSPDQRYGRTPLVLALMAHLWQAEATDLGRLAHVAAYVDGAVH